MSTFRFLAVYFDGRGPEIFHFEGETPEKAKHRGISELSGTKRGAPKELHDVTFVPSQVVERLMKLPDDTVVARMQTVVAGDKAITIPLN